MEEWVDYDKNGAKCVSFKRFRLRSGLRHGTFLYFFGCLDMSFQGVRTSLVIGYGDGLLNDEEFILLYDAFKSQNPVYPYWKFNRFCLDDLESSECEAMFRVRKDDFAVLMNALNVPETFTCRQGTTCDGIEGLSILLKILGLFYVMN